MNEILSNPSIMYCIIGLIVVGVGISGVYIKKKFKITKKDADLFKLIVNTIDYVTQNYDIKYKGNISIIIQYVYGALDFVNKYDTTKTLDEKQELVKNKALFICKKKNIKVDDDTVDLIDNLAEYVVKVIKK